MGFLGVLELRVIPFTTNLRKVHLPGVPGREACSLLEIFILRPCLPDGGASFEP